MSASLPLRRGDVRSERLPDGSGMLFDPRTGVAYAITASAVLVWDACDGAHSLTAIVDQLAEVYEAPAEIIARDVPALLHDLCGRGLLEPAPDTGE